VLVLAEPGDHVLEHAKVCVHQQRVLIGNEGGRLVLQLVAAYGSGTRDAPPALVSRLMTTLRIPTAPVFRPLLEPARYKGAYGGRGSGKSHFFGELMVERGLVNPGTLAGCICEGQKKLLQSSKRLIESKIQSLGVGAHFQVLHDRIVTPGDGLIIFQGMQDSTAESIKSLEGFSPPLPAALDFQSFA